MRVDAINLDKHFRSLHAVNDLSFSVVPGRVTGFLGPNGSGKSTTMRLMLGLDNGSGSTLWDGKPLTAHKPTTRVVGAHLDAKFFHPKRSAYQHLRMLATEAGISKARVEETIELVGLSGVAKKRPGGFSLGMGQRLGLAGAILAEPKVLMLDEPANGLDPQSISWLRDFLKQYAARGNSVLVSSHLLSEMQLLADDLVVIAKGTLIAAEPLDSFLNRASSSSVKVRSAEALRLATALTSQGLNVEVRNDSELSVSNVTSDQIGEIAFRERIPLAELSATKASLEEVFIELTEAHQQYQFSSVSTANGEGVQQ